MMPSHRGGTIQRMDDALTALRAVEKDTSNFWDPLPDLEAAFEKASQPPQEGS